MQEPPGDCLGTVDTHVQDFDFILRKRGLSR